MIVGHNFQIRFYPVQGTLRPFVLDGNGKHVQNTALDGEILWRTLEYQGAHPPLALESQPQIYAQQSPDGHGLHAALTDLPPTHELVKTVTDGLRIRHFAASIDLRNADVPTDGSFYRVSTLDTLPQAGRYMKRRAPSAPGTVYDDSGLYNVRMRPGTVRVQASAPELADAIAVLSDLAGVSL